MVVKYLIGFALGWSVARHLAGQPIVPRPVKRVFANVVNEQLPPMQNQPVLPYVN